MIMKSPINYSLSILIFFIIKELFESLYSGSILLVLSVEWNDPYLYSLFVFAFIICFALQIIINKKIFLTKPKIKLLFVLTFFILFLILYSANNYFTDLSLSVTSDNEKVLKNFGTGNIFSIILQILIIGYYSVISFIKKDD